MTTYLNEEQGKGTKYIRPSVAAREASIPEGHAVAILSQLTDDGALKAKLKVRCPECGSSHGGVFEKQSDVPESSQTCMCGNTFSMENKSNWYVVYEITDGNVDFFLDVGERLEVFTDSDIELSPTDFWNNFNDLENMKNNSVRGQKFDYFVGLLFAQIEGVDVFPRFSGGDSGEVDVYANLSRADSWMIESIGTATLVENKWEDADKTRQDDVNAFESKVKEVHHRHGTKVAFFLSMSEYTSDALDSLDQNMSPRIVPLHRDDLEEMIAAGTAEPVLRDRTLY